MAHEWWHDIFGSEEFIDMGFGYNPDEEYYSESLTDYEPYSTAQETFPMPSFQHYEPYDYEPQVQTYSSPEGTFGSGDVYGIGEEGGFGGTISQEEYLRERSEQASQQLQDIPPEEEQSYASVAREWIDKIAPFLGGAAKIKKFADDMGKKGQRQGGGGGGGGRQIKAPYTTHKAGTSGRTQANIQSSFQGRDSRQLMAMLSQQSRQAASGVQIVANKAADVGDPIKGNDLYDLISGETKPLGAKQQLPTGQSFRSLSIRRTQRA